MTAAYTNRFPKIADLFTMYTYPTITSARFTYHKHPSGGGYLDDGRCPVCNSTGVRVYIDPKGEVPKMCYKCYVLMHDYRNRSVDTLGLHKRRVLSTEDCRRIRAHMHGTRTAVKTAVGTGLIAAFLEGFFGRDR